MSEKTSRPKSTKEKDLKIVRVQIVGKRSAIDSDLKRISAFFSLEGTFSIEKTKNDKYKNFSLILIRRVQKFTWQEDFHFITRVLLTDTYSTVVLSPCEIPPNGVEFETTRPLKITPKEAQTLIDKGAYCLSLDENDNLTTSAITIF